MFATGGDWVMSRKHTPVMNSNRQDGIALLVSMILIFVMSLLGISAMRSATLEGRMVSNSFQKELTLQAAESASDSIVADNVKIEAAICAPNEKQYAKANLNANGKLTTSSTIEYGGATLVRDFSLGGEFGSIKFITGGESTINNTNTTSRVSQGVVLIGPAQMSRGCQ